ncbi:hypothetical protein GWK47_032285 [Chionoecetes opilio]|uniref:Uncharacterized protein n=1 Tax=Chionoecetes opilio TaxID=41210 RepID=A0A8J5CQ55_CHIOP|nr:hypothetical protein GWK47_032285 [Chionoecetes opilio]
MRELENPYESRFLGWGSTWTTVSKIKREKRGKGYEGRGRPTKSRQIGPPISPRDPQQGKLFSVPIREDFPLLPRRKTGLCNLGPLSLQCTDPDAPCDPRRGNTKFLVHHKIPEVGHHILGRPGTTLLSSSSGVHFATSIPRLTRVPFGSGKNFLFLHINAICSTLGKEKSTRTRFQATGGDTTSSFFWKGKNRFGNMGAYTEVPKPFNLS